jgi:hypothetical protein
MKKNFAVIVTCNNKDYQVTIIKNGVKFGFILTEKQLATLYFAIEKKVTLK